MAMVETYVDPSIAANSGSGTAGDPYGDLQYALDQTSGSHRFNVIAGTDEIMAGSLDFSTRGTPGKSGQVIIQGCTATAGDGGVGGIDMNGLGVPFLNATQYVHLADLEIHNGTGAELCKLSAIGMSIRRCEIHDCTQRGITLTGSAARVIGSRLYDCDVGVYGGYVMGCRFENGAERDFSTAALSCTLVNFSTFKLSGSSIGIWAYYYRNVLHNSFYGGGGTGTGIKLDAYDHSQVIANNVVSAFSGIGGRGIYCVSPENDSQIFGNSLYNNTTDENWGDLLPPGNDGQNEILGSDPFANASGGDFTPNDVGNIIGGAYPELIGGQSSNLNRGAIQNAAGAAGAAGMLRRSNMRGGY